MSKEREALKQALTALKSIDEAMPFPVAKFAIRQLEEALAEESSGTEQPKLSDYEPDGMHHNKPHKCKYPKCDYPCPDLPDCRDAEQTVEEYDPDNRTISVYPSEWKAQQEPVAKVVTDNSRELVVESLTSKYLRKGTKLYTSPPASKPWVGLSTIELDEIDAPIRERGHATIAEIYRAIESKLKERNT